MIYSDEVEKINRMVDVGDKVKDTVEETINNNLLEKRNLELEKNIKSRKVARTGLGISADLEEQSPGGGGSGGALPLTEKGNEDGYDIREYFPDETVELGDGIHQMTISPIKKIKFLDSEGIEGEITFLNPYDEEE